MAINRLNKDSDATWCRAWVIDTTAEVTAFMATYNTPLGPKRGDMIVDNEEAQLFLVTNGTGLVQITGNATLPIDLLNDVINTLPVTNGGLGFNTVAQGDIIYGNATDTLAKLNKDTNATRYLSNTGTNNNPLWALVNLASGVTGVLPTANGGTSVDIASAALPLGSGQITFPATQNPSSDANTLDDYEEGSWTPVIGGAGGTTGQTYTTQTGRYIKIGKNLTLWFRAVLSNKGTITGNLEIQGLPFASANITTQTPVCPIQWTTTTLYALVQGIMSPNTSVIQIRAVTVPATSPVNITTLDIGNTSIFTGTISIQTED